MAVKEKLSGKQGMGFAVANVCDSGPGCIENWVGGVVQDQAREGIRMGLGEHHRHRTGFQGGAELGFLVEDAGKLV